MNQRELKRSKRGSPSAVTHLYWFSSEKSSDTIWMKTSVVCSRCTLQTCWRLLIIYTFLVSCCLRAIPCQSLSNDKEKNRTSNSLVTVCYYLCDSPYSSISLVITEFLYVRSTCFVVCSQLTAFIKFEFRMSVSWYCIMVWSHRSN